MVLVTSFCFLRTRWDTAVMKLPSPNDSSLFSYVQVCLWRKDALLNLLNAELNLICHLLALLGAHHILHVSRVRVKRLLSIHLAFSSFLRRRLFKSVTPNFIINSNIPMLSSVLPSIHLPMHLCTCTAERCSENNRACKLTTWVLVTRRICSVVAFRLTHIFGGKRNESWMGFGNTVHFARSYTIPENYA